MQSNVAIVGMSCCYPDTNSPGELWNNVLAGRRAFRRIPPERLRLEDYFAADEGAEDSLYSTEGAFIEGYEFDRVRFRIAGSTYRAADLAHWLALDVAARALSDAGFDEGEGLPRETTGVFLGNTLTGEFSRAGVMRLRWPYVRRVAEAALAGQGLSATERRDLLSTMEESYKSPFPPVGAETLAGGLSNTIAGRICNHFDLKGGGYTVDGACASSLLAVTNACTSLMDGDLDVALAGGVDLSIDPFELVGFAKAGALAKDEMRVYDRRSAGFWPGEGCGFVVLMRLEDARARAARVYAVIRGWGVSSDGSGGITRPEVEGQMLALERAYRRAGYGIDTVNYFEGHGTGTSIGDTTELKALTSVRRLADPDAPAAAISSVKANIGHTKAAAGVAGLLKAAMALHTQTLPPTAGCVEPHAELAATQSALRVLRKGECWPAERHLRASVSAMGFGGINAHVTLEGADGVRRRTFSRREREVLASAQDAELLLLAAPDATELLRQVEHLLTFVARLSRAELTDLAVTLGMAASEEAPGACPPWRAAVVASTPTELDSALRRLRQWLADGTSETKLDVKAGVFMGTLVTPRVGFLFPGQAAPVYLSGGALARRFETVEELYGQSRLPAAGDTRSTELAQPSIVTASLAGLRVLERLGVVARVGVGHSLGELTALHWAGAMREDELLRLASLRARTMAEAGGGAAGKMICIRAGRAEVEAVLNGDRVSIAGLNAPGQTVVAGEAAAVERFAARVKTLGHAVVNLNVSHAFHSPLMAEAAPHLLRRLRAAEFGRLQGRVISTVTGACLAPNADLPDLLGRQLTTPVRFVEAATAAAEEVDFFIEVGPGQILSGLVGEFLEQPCIPLDAGGESLRGLLKAAGAAFAAGVALDRTTLYSGRYARPFNLNWQPRFFRNPCELAPLSNGTEPLTPVESDESEVTPHSLPSPDMRATGATTGDALELVRLLVAERAELPPEAVCDDHRLLGDLHLNSLTVSQIVVEAARRRGLAPPTAPTEYALATVAEIARALEEMAAGGSNPPPAPGVAPGVAAWVRSFTVELSEQTLRQSPVPAGDGEWRVIALDNCPLAPRLREAFARVEGSGVVVCLPTEMDERHLSLLLDGARAVAEEGSGRFVLVQQGRSAAAFARSLKLEMPGTCVAVVNVPAGHRRSVEWVLAEAQGCDDYAEAFYDEAGIRRVPVLRPLPLPTSPSEVQLGADDLILVTGGGKGIAAECALALAQESGASLALLGRSQPADDPELSNNLERMATAGIRFRYVAADVTDAAAVRDAIARVETEMGSVTAVLHGAGVNTPRPLRELDEETFRRTLAPKVRGSRNVLAALDPARLRLFVTFGSLIARTGMRGEADYAVANEWLTDLTAEWQAAHTHCRCLAVEWSVWSGVGMGQRLGSVEALIRQGITPISVDEGVATLRRLLGHQPSAGAVLVTGRFGLPPTLRLEQKELPLLRFLEECQVHYPGVELVAEARLSAETDPYLRDHVFQGEQLFPAVMGLEAMAQAAHALTGLNVPPCFESVKFERPVSVPPDGSTLMRVAALARETGEVEVVLRSEQTAFQVDHFRAVCRFPEELFEETIPAADFLRASETNSTERPAVALEPARDLYGQLLFHQGRFQRVRRYQHLTSTECVAEIERDGFTKWFGPYIPGALLLGDPGRRDATIHAIQSCVPRATILPVGVERLWVAPGQTTDDCLVHARERSFDGQTFTYDVEVRGTDGRVWERWEGLLLRAVGGAAYEGQWAAPLLGPHLERRVRELVPGSGIRVAVEAFAEQDASVAGRRRRGERAVRRLVPAGVRVTRRPDGKPELSSRQHLSLSHARDLTLAVVDGQPLACDAEAVAARAPSVWRDLLGAERFALAELLTRLSGDDLDTAATRVWAAGECLKKVGALDNAPLTLGGVAEGEWVSLNAPPHLLLTYPAEMLGSGERLVFAVLAGKVG